MATTRDDPRRYLDARVLSNLKGLELKARLIVEGFVTGLHESPYKGSSAEFAEHREYAPGDDIRFLDWKVFGRSDRFYVKEFEEETNLKAYVALDTSRSMEYASGGVSKLEYGRYVAASLAWLMTQQQDAAALILWDTELRRFLPPQNSTAHLRNILRALEEAEPGGDTDMGRMLTEMAERIRQKSLLILVSDFLDDIARIETGLKRLAHKGHDVILFHVLDNDEIEFPLDRMTLFEGLEGPGRLLADPRALREAYLAELRTFQKQLRATCFAGRMDYVILNTSAGLDVALSSYVASRARRR